MQPIDTAVIGAGPYGLSVAAHLRAAGVPHEIFGEPLES
jgi:FAD-dependent urate hydroxylase